MASLSQALSSASPRRHPSPVMISIPKSPFLFRSPWLSPSRLSISINNFSHPSSRVSCVLNPPLISSSSQNMPKLLEIGSNSVKLVFGSIITFIPKLMKLYLGCAILFWALAYMVEVRTSIIKLHYKGTMSFFEVIKAILQIRPGVDDDVFLKVEAERTKYEIEEFVCKKIAFLNTMAKMGVKSGGESVADDAAGTPFIQESGTDGYCRWVLYKKLKEQI